MWGHGPFRALMWAKCELCLNLLLFYMLDLGYIADESGKHLVIQVYERTKKINFVDIFASGFWTMARAEDGRIFTCGLNNFGQLGLPLPQVDHAANG